MIQIREQEVLLSKEERKTLLQELYRLKVSVLMNLRNQEKKKEELRILEEYIFFSSKYQIRLLAGESVDEISEDILDNQMAIHSKEERENYLDMHLHALTDAYLKLVTIGYEKDGIIYKRVDDSKNRIIRVYRKEMGKKKSYGRSSHN